MLGIQNTTDSDVGSALFVMLGMSGQMFFLTMTDSVSKAANFPCTTPVQIRIVTSYHGWTVLNFRDTKLLRMCGKQAGNTEKLVESSNPGYMYCTC